MSTSYLTKMSSNRKSIGLDGKSVVVFDLFGVIIDFNDSIVSRRIAHHCRNRDIALDALQDIVSNRNLISGSMTLFDLYKDIQDNLGLRQSYQEFHAQWMEPYTQTKPGIECLLNKISGAADIVLLSNVDPYYWPTIIRLHPIVQKFKARILSFECGLTKPDPEIFHYAERVAGFRAEDCFFLDDKAENIEAARMQGWSGFEFSSVQAFLRSANNNSN